MVCEKLRYDLTVPFARFVVQHQNELISLQAIPDTTGMACRQTPERSLQGIFQCDADVIGSDALYNEFEMIQLVDAVFNRFIRVLLKINNRKVLALRR